MLGCLSCEERCLATYQYMSANRFLTLQRLFLIEDPESVYSALSRTKLTSRSEEYVRGGGCKNDIENHPLFERIELLVNSANAFITMGHENIVLDVTSFPKRFFLPILRLLMQAESVKSLIVTYTVAEQYAIDSLAEDPEPWRHLPLFAPPFPEPKARVLIIGLGFETLGLPDLVEHDFHDVDTRLLFPFPPGPPAFQRTWEFVRRLEAGVLKHSHEPMRVAALDTSDIFDHILSVTDEGRKYAVLAPFGPKPMSVAMGIYATLTQCPVYYTQPRVYNPNYSVGIKRCSGGPEIYGYCVKLQGKDFYRLPA